MNRQAKLGKSKNTDLDDSETLTEEAPYSTEPPRKRTKQGPKKSLTLRRATSAIDLIKGALHYPLISHPVSDRVPPDGANHAVRVEADGLLHHARDSEGQPGVRTLRQHSDDR